MNDAITLTGGHVLGPDGLRDGPLTLAGGVIADGAGARRLDATGCLILPGIVDAHGDGFERHLAPRRGAVTDLGAGLRSLENELASNGITTAALAQFWSWEGGMRGSDFAAKLAAALDAHDGALDLCLQLRFEYAMADDAAAVERLIDAHGIGCLVFNDHLPHAALDAGRRVPRLEGQAIKSGRSPKAHQALLERLHAALPEARAALPDLCASLRERGVILGSHDDHDASEAAFWSGLGAGICEFPLSAEAARAARDRGRAVVLGAPNVLRGGSHKRGGISAADLVRTGLCDALASDYHYPAPLGAIRRLVDEGEALAALWPLVSAGPASLLGMSDRGRIAAGQRADVILTDPGLSRVLAVFVAGRPVRVAEGLAARWILD